MASARTLFFSHLAQTSPAPVALHIDRAEGFYLYEPGGKRYADLISGISVSLLGHSHPAVVQAVQQQASRHMHLMVYGEYVQDPQVQLAEKLAHANPWGLSSVYFTNSGTEAIEGALKLAKRVTSRPDIIVFENAYHGATHGSLSAGGSNFLKQAYRPLVPGTRVCKWNDDKVFDYINDLTAAILMEPVQAEAGIRLPDATWLRRLHERCTKTGTLLIVDEIQTGLGRTGSFWASEAFGMHPDILVSAKALGAGMPLGAFMAKPEHMALFTHNPVLGHITTFGGHPVSCAAALAGLHIIQSQKLWERACDIEGRIRHYFQHHPQVQQLRVYGALAAVELGSNERVMRTIEKAMDKGVITDWFLYCPTALRIAPPLTVTEKELNDALQILADCID